MTYQACLDFLYGQLPVFQKQGRSAFKPSLRNTERLCEHLGNPETSFKAIHVAGTNGKGSVCHLLHSIYQEAGLKVGLYTSPHLIDFRERIQVNNEYVSKEFVVDFVTQHQPFIEELKPSFFEVCVAMCFSYFGQQSVDLAIIETGLGGRLDSTNVLYPILSIITNIGLDHTEFLGNSLEEIAAEKAGIIKKGTPVIIGRRQPETEKVFNTKATELEAPLEFAKDRYVPSLHREVRPAYQYENLATSLTAINTLQRILPCTESAVKRGIDRFFSGLNSHGRWQVIQKSPLVIADAAHNTPAIKVLAQEVNNMTFKNLRIIIGLVADKSIDSVLEALPKTAIYYTCAAAIPRALSSANLSSKMAAFEMTVKDCSSPKQALKMALNDSEEQDLILVTGSFFVIGELLEHLDIKLVNQ